MTHNQHDQMAPKSERQKTPGLFGRLRHPLGGVGLRSEVIVPSLEQQYEDAQTKTEYALLIGGRVPYEVKQSVLVTPQTIDINKIVPNEPGQVRIVSITGNDGQAYHMVAERRPEVDSRENAARFTYCQVREELTGSDTPSYEVDYVTDPHDLFITQGNLNRTGREEEDVIAPAGTTIALLKPVYIPKTGELSIVAPHRDKIVDVLAAVSEAQPPISFFVD